MSLDFFAKLSTTEQVILLLTLLSALGLTLWFLKWVITRITDSLGFTFEGGRFRVKVKGESDIQHKDCPRFRDFLLMLQLQQLMLNKIFHIRDNEILREQMAYAENKIDMFITVNEESFCKLLEGNPHITDYLYTPEYVAHKSLLEYKREKLLTKFRHMCKENHFVEKSDEDFREYIRNNTMLIIGMTIQLSKTFYPFYLELKGYAESLEPEHDKLTAYVSSMLLNAREVTLRYNKQIDDLQDAFEAEYEKVVGMKPTRIKL